MLQVLRKLSWTAQGSVPAFKPVMEEMRTRYNRLRSRPHDRDFEVLRMLDAHAPGVYIDGGANRGQSIQAIRLFRPSATIIAFEANPRLAAMVAQRYSHDPAVKVVPAALGDQQGELDFFIPSYRGVEFDALASADRSAAMEWINGTRVFFFDPTKLAARRVCCPVTTIDSEQLDPIFIKLDLQGFEYQALHGAVETLLRCEPILMVEDYHGDPRLEPLAYSLGYREYYYDGASLVRGRAPSTNAFLITEARARAERL